MIILLILTIVITVCIYILYRIGKKIKEKEEQFKAMMSENDAKDRLRKYKRKSTPKVPRVNK